MLHTNISFKTGKLVQAECGWDDLQKLSSLELKLFYGKEAMTLQDELGVVNPCGENIFLGTWIIYSSMVQWSLLVKFCCIQRFHKFRSFNHFIYETHVSALTQPFRIKKAFTVAYQVDDFNGLSNTVPGRDSSYIAFRGESEFRNSYLFLPYIPLYFNI